MLTRFDDLKDTITISHSLIVTDSHSKTNSNSGVTYLVHKFPCFLNGLLVNNESRVTGRHSIRKGALQAVQDRSEAGHRPWPRPHSGGGPGLLTEREPNQPNTSN